MSSADLTHPWLARPVDAVMGECARSDGEVLLTQAQAVKRLEVLAPQLQQEFDAAFDQCPGQEAIVQALMLLDGGMFSAEQAIASIRRHLGLSDPILTSAREHSQLSHALYAGLLPGAASDSVAGG